MAIIDSRKVDYLWKKLGYGRSKTDVNSIKNATNESIASPLFLRGDTIWAQSDVIPAVIPSSSLEAVQVYPTTSPVECVADITASANRTWKTNAIDWIPPEIGDTYQVKVYVHASGDAVSAASGGQQLFAAGSGNDDEWFFDYQSGVLHFIGTNLPNGVNFSGKSIYISGARYTGVKGVPAPGTATTFTSVGVGSHFSVTGFSTFTNTVDINNGAYIDNIQIGITGDNEIDTTTGNLIIDSFEGTVTVDDRLIVAGLSTFNSDVDFDSNVNIDSTLIVTGVSTFTGNIDANGDLDVDGYTELDTVNISEKLNVVGVSTFASDLDINASVNISTNLDVVGDLDVDGYTELDTVNVSEKLNVVGVSTFGSDLDINADVDISGELVVDGTSDLDHLNVTGLSTFSDHVRIKSDDFLKFGDSDHFSIFAGVGGQTFLTQHASQPLSILGNTSLVFKVNGSENAIIATANGSVELYWDNSKRLETTGSGIDITGHIETDTFNVSGLSTFASNVDINADLDVDGYTELDTVNVSEKLNVVGVSTFGSDLDINADVDISGELVVDGTSDLDHLNVAGLSTFASNVDINADLDVSGHTELDNVNVSENVLVAGVVTATSFHTGAEGSAIRINSSSITGPANLTIDPAGVGDNTGLVIIAGDLQVDGTQTIINSTSVTIDDLNIMLADGAANDAAADGGGFTVQSGDGNKTFQFEATGDNFGSSEHINLATGKTLKIANTEVLRSDLLTVANAALSGVTTVGTTLDVNGDLDVDGYTELDTVNVSEKLNVVGVTTLGSNVDINADLDVDGNTELDGLNVDGTTTLDGTTIDGTLVVNGDIDLSGDIDIDGYTELDTVNVSEKLNVVGVSTFGSDLDINANVDISGELVVDGTSDLDHLNVAGLSTFASDLDINASVNISTNLDVVGDLDVDGYTELDTVNISEKLNVVGVSTFGSDLDINASVNISTNLDVDGVTTLDVTTIDGLLTVNSGEIHANAGLTVNTAIVEDLTDNRVVIAGTGGELEDDANLTFDGSTLSVGVNLDVDGATTLDDTTIDGTLTLNGNLDLSNGIDVDGTSDLDHLNVAGLSTFASNVDINADVDISGELVVDGTSDFDHLNVAGLSTFTNTVEVKDTTLQVTNSNFGSSGNYLELKQNTDGTTEINKVGGSAFYIGGSNIYLKKDTTNDVYAGFVDGGRSFLNYDSNTKIETTASGIDVTGIAETDDLKVTGVSTFTGNIDANGDLDVDGTTELDVLNVAETATFSSNIDANGDLDVDGTTELDVLNVAELATFSANIDANGNVDISGELVVDGTSDLDELNVAGLSTFASNVDINASVNISTNLDVDGATTLDDTTIDGTLTLNGSLDLSNGIDVDGTSDLDHLNVAGLSTFASNVDINADVDISGELVVDGTSDLDHLNVTGIATISDRLDVNGDLHDIAGTIALDNVDVSGIVSATKFDGDINALGNTYYVATTGSDSNSGDNINEPYLTIAKALTVATSGDIVYVGAGVFDETCPLTIPSGVTVRGAGLRATTIRPTTATKTNNVFLLSDVSTLEDFTIKGSYYDSTNDTGYAFSYASGITIATRSPYIQRVTVLNRGSVVTTADPYGFDTADSPPTSYIAGRGAKVDGSLVTSSSIEAGMLFNEVTFFTPNNKGVILTNGARAEYLNCFHYFASQAIVGQVGTTGIGGNANTRLKFSNPNVTPSANDVVKLYNSSGVGIATGTIVTYSSDYATISGLGIGTFTSVGAGTTQDVRFFQSDGTTQTGVADSILLADYTMFGAEMRSVGCAVEYGTQGVVADGNGVKLRMFATNFNHVGSGKDFSNDTTLTIQANEVVELNNGQVSYVSIDQGGDFRVGDALFIDQETGNVSFAATSYSLDVTGTIDVTDGTNTSTLTPTSITVGGLQLASNQLSSLSGDITIDPSGSSKTVVQGDLDVNGTLNASVVNIDAIQRGDTSISITDTGTDGTIIFYTENSEAFRINNTQATVFTGNIDANGDLDVDGTTELDVLNVAETATFSSNIDANGDLDVDGTTELDVLNVAETATFSSNIDVNGDLHDIAGTIALDNVNISGIATATAFHTGAEGSAIRVSSDTISGPATLNIDPAGVGDNTGTVVIKGDLQVDGTQTIINSTTVTVNDLNIQVADGAANDAAADGAGITVNSGDGNKTFQFEATGDNFGSSEHINLATGKTYKINNTEVLSSTRLTVSEIVASGIGTIATIDATNATIDNLTFTSGTAITSVDTDLASVSASDDTLASAKAIKTYVDAQVTVQDLDIIGDTGTGAVDLDSQSLTVAGTANEIETSVSNQTITVGLPDDITVSTSLTVGSNTVLVDAGIVAGIITATSFVGPLTGAVTGNVTGDLTGNVTGNVTGDLTGNVTGDVTGNLTGNVTGDITGNLTGSVTDTSGTSSFNNVTVSGIVTSNAGFAGTVLSQDGTGYVLIPGASASDTSQLYNTNLYDSLGRVVTHMVADQIHWAGVSDGLTGTPDIEVGIVTATGQVESNVGFAGTVLSKDGTGYVLIPGDSASDTSQLYNTNLYDSLGRVVTNMVADQIHWAGVADGLYGQPDIHVGIVTATHLQVTGVSTFANTQVSTSVASPVFNTDHSSIGSIEFITSGTAAVTGHILDGAAFRSVEYLIQAVDGANMHLTKILAIHDGAGAVMMTEYGTVFNNAPLASYDMVMNGPNAELMITAASPNATTYKITFTAIAI